MSALKAKVRGNRWSPFASVKAAVSYFLGINVDPAVMWELCTDVALSRRLIFVHPSANKQKTALTKQGNRMNNNDVDKCCRG